MYNFDGDLLFTCSDDNRVCVYHTSDCRRIGVFNTHQACKSIDVTDDSKYLLAGTATPGFYLFEVATGRQLMLQKSGPGKKICSHVEFSFGDKKFLTVQDTKDNSSVIAYDFDKFIK